MGEDRSGWVLDSAYCLHLHLLFYSYIVYSRFDGMGK